MSATLAAHLQLLQVIDALKPVLLSWRKDLIKFKENFSFRCFCQVAINMHFVLVGFSAIKFVQRQSVIHH